MRENKPEIVVYPFADRTLLLHLQWASPLRSAPFELPQGGNEARVEGCSGAIKVACPFFTFFRLTMLSMHNLPLKAYADLFRSLLFLKLYNHEIFH